MELSKDLIKAWGEAEVLKKELECRRMWLEATAKRSLPRRLEKLDSALLGVSQYVRLLLLGILDPLSVNVICLQVRKHIFNNNNYNNENTKDRI